jgi:hypothetical protein
MEVLACIPELPCLAGPVATAVCEPPLPAEVPVTRISTPSPALAVAASEPDDADDEECVSPAPRHGRAHRSRPAGLFSPSIITLTALAVVVWAAAWRNDRLRLEASRQQRPERLAQELQATAGTARSVTP